MRLRRASMECLLAGTPALLIFVWWMFREGGYFERSWMPGAVLLLAVGAASAIALRGELALPSRAAKAAVAAFAAYVLWSFASIAWAGNPGDAFEGSQRALLYLACFALFALLPWTPRSALVALLAFVATMTVVGVVTAARLAGDTPIGELFVDARLRAPVGYHNAAAALWTMAAVPALVLAARREVGPWLRPLLLAAATLLLGLTVLCQSRGWLYTLPLVLLAALLLSPDRLKLVPFAAFALCEVAIAAPDLLAVNSAGADLDPVAAQRAVRPVLDGAMTTLAATTAGALVAGIALVYAEAVLRDRVVLGAGARRLLGAALAVAVIAGGSGAALVATGGDPLGRVDSAWTQFTDVDSDVADGGSHLATFGSTRYDFWRVGLEVWREHPLLGLGQDNFVDAYARLRRSAFEEPRWVHSLPLRLLAHTGAVGAALFLAFLGAIAVAASGAWRRARGDAARAAVGAALLPLVVWLAHGSVDWLWEFPALSCAALAFAGAAVALGRPDESPAAGGAAEVGADGAAEPGADGAAEPTPSGDPEPEPEPGGPHEPDRAAEQEPVGAPEPEPGGPHEPDRAAEQEPVGAPEPEPGGAPKAARGGALEPRARSARAQRAVVAGAVASVLAGVVILVPSLVSDSEVSEAALHWREDPPRALDRLDLARTLNPLAARPWLVEGQIQADRDNLRAARDAFARAGDKQPDAWYPRFAYGLLARSDGDLDAARRALRAARRRNPRDPLVAEALRRVRLTPMSFDEALRRLAERLALRRNQEP